MTITSIPASFSGNILVSDGERIRYDSMLNTEITGGIPAHPSITAGTGAPTFTAAQGSLYLRIDGSSTSTRLYVNTNGSTTWTNVTTAA
jgi:hypothetical protein